MKANFIVDVITCLINNKVQKNQSIALDYNVNIFEIDDNDKFLNNFTITTRKNNSDGGSCIDNVFGEIG